LEALPGSTSRGGWPGSASFRVWRRRRPPRDQGAHRSSHSSPPPRPLLGRLLHASRCPHAAGEYCRRVLLYWRLLDGRSRQRRAAERGAGRRVEPRETPRERGRGAQCGVARLPGGRSSTATRDAHGTRDGPVSCRVSTDAGRAAFDEHVRVYRRGRPVHRTVCMCVVGPALRIT
jgi:hypothetical protein